MFHQGSELSHLLPEEKRDELKKAFQKLDTDSDGYDQYKITIYDII